MTCEQIRLQMTAFLSEELDGDAGDTIRAHVEECAACAAEVELLRRILAQISGVGVRAMPEPVAGRIRQEVAKHCRPTRRSIFAMRRSWAFASVLPILVALIVGLILLRQQPLTAAQILTRTKTAITKLSSWHFRYKSTVRVDGKVRDTRYADEWYRAPDRHRYQEEPSGACYRPSLIKLIRGNEELLYDPKQNVANYRALRPEDQRNEAESSERRSMKPPYAAARYHMRAIRLVGTERVLGRVCDVVTGLTGTRYRVRICVDRETGVPLRSVMSEGDTEFTSEALVFEPNKAIGDDIFQIKLPSDAVVIRGPLAGPGDLASVDLARLKNPFETESMMRLNLSESVGSALKVVYAPTCVPAGYRLYAVYPDYTYLKPGVRRDYRSLSIDASYTNPGTGGSLLLIQSVEKLFGEGDAVTVQGVEGRISSVTSPYSYSILVWAKQGTHFALIGSGLDRPELLKIANGLKPLESLVSGLGTGRTWRITAQAVNARDDEYVAVTPDVLWRRLRILGAYNATVERKSGDRIEIAARAKDPDLIVRSVLAPGFVSFVPVPSASAAARSAIDRKPLITQDEVLFSAKGGLGAGKPVFLNVRLRYPFYAARLRTHDGSHASGVLAIMLDDRRFVTTVTKQALISGTRIGPLPADVAAVLLTGPLPAELKILSTEAL